MPVEAVAIVTTTTTTAGGGGGAAAGDERALCGPPTQRDPRYGFTANCRRAHRRFGSWMRLDEFARSKRHAAAYAGKALADFDVIVRWNHRNLRATVDPQDPDWFARLRDNLARLISLGTEQPLDARRIRLEVSSSPLGSSSIQETPQSLDELYRHSVLGLRLIVLAKEEGRLVPLAKPPVYLYPELPALVPGTLSSELERNNALGETRNAAQAVRRVLEDSVVPIAARLVKMRAQCPDGLVATEAAIQQALYTRPSAAACHLMSPGDGRLRAALEAAWCPNVAHTANEIAYELARRVCKVKATADPLSDADVDASMAGSCEQVCALFERRATAWRARQAARQVCPSPVAAAAAIPVELHTVGAPIGRAAYERIDAHLIEGSYADPYRAALALGATPQEVAEGSASNRIFAGETAKLIASDARASNVKRAVFTCKAIARKHREHRDHHHHHHHQHHDEQSAKGMGATGVASAAALPVAQAATAEFGMLRTRVLNGRPDADIIRVSPLANLVPPPALAPPTAAAGAPVPGYADNTAGADLAALGLRRIDCRHCAGTVLLLGVSDARLASVVPSACRACAALRTAPATAAAAAGAAPPTLATGAQPLAEAASDDADDDVQVEIVTGEPDEASPPETPRPASKSAVGGEAAAAAAPPAAAQARAPSEGVDMAEMNEAPAAKSAAPRDEGGAAPALPVSMQEALNRPLPESGPLETAAVERPLPPVPPVGTALLRVSNSSARPITVRLTNASGRATAEVLAMTVAANSYADSQPFPYGKHRVAIVDAETGAPLGAGEPTWRFTQRSLHAIDFTGTGPTRMRVAHLYAAERIAPISWFWDRVFGRPGQPFRGSADTGIYVLPSAGLVQDEPHLLVKASADGVRQHLAATIEDDGLLTGAGRTTYAAFSAAPHASNLGAPLTLVRDELNGKMAVRRANGEDGWAPITSVLQVSSSTAASGHGSVLFVVDAPMEDIVRAAKQ